MIDINIVTEAVGFAGSALVIMSMLYKTSTYKGALMLRVVNLIGSFVFIAYGFMLPAISTIVLNIIAVFINTTQILKLKKEYEQIMEDLDE